MTDLCRSVFFVPADSEKKLAKSETLNADITVYDLEDSVAPANRVGARELLGKHFAETQSTHRHRCVRINPLGGDDALADLAAVVRHAPSSIMLPKFNHVEDVDQLSYYLDALEVREGVEPGTIGIIAIVTETAASMFAHGGLQFASPRLIGVTWGAEDLAAALHAASNKTAHGAWTFTYQMARSQCLLAARSVGAFAIDTVYTDFRDSAGLTANCADARRDGFDGKLAIHPNQIDVINDVFTPSDAELTEARAIIEAFDGNPTAGVLQLDGQMIDRPHLVKAENLLARYEAIANRKNLLNSR